MIGNDIVDLQQAEQDSNWKRPGYLDKLFTSEEQFLIASAVHPDVMVWLLWTMKESTYKIESKTNKLHEFAPVKLICNNLIIHEDTATGNVTYGNQVYFTKSILLTEYIHTIAGLTSEELDAVRIAITTPIIENYRINNPSSISHHGKYLALAYE
ncbi:phosphopantetheinyl transferase (holo-ACP synthase) [Pedobacter sp. UYP24]